jgi:hypothetical protein
MTCATKCALCGEVLDQYLPYLGVERTMAAHAVGCPSRPIAVGDDVEARMCGAWDTQGKVTGRVRGCEHAFVVTVASGPAGTVGQELAFGREALRRIPRPGAGEQRTTVGPLQGLTINFAAGLPYGSIVVRTGPGRYEARWNDGSHAVRVESAYRGRSACPAIAICEVMTTGLLKVAVYPPGAYDPRDLDPGDEVTVNVTTAPVRGGQHDPPPPRCACGGDHPPCEAHARHLKPTGPLVDGLTVAECDSRWSDNRYRLEAGLPQRHALTDAQIAAGRASWQARNHPRVSALVRERVAAGREAERNRVRVEVQDVD